MAFFGVCSFQNITGGLFSDQWRRVSILTKKQGMNDKDYHFRVRVVISITMTYTYLAGVFRDIVSLLG